MSNDQADKWDDQPDDDDGMINAIAWAVVGMVVIMGAVLVMVCQSPAQGPASKWGHDAETSEWFKSLHGKNGFPCCDYVDGARIEDPDWREIDGGAYEVTVAGEVITIPPDKIVDATNRVGYAILWRSKTGSVYCSLPGSRT